MTDKEEIFLLLDDVFMKVDYKLRLKALVSSMDREIEGLKSDKMEAYKAIEGNYTSFYGNGNRIEFCIQCKENYPTHTNDCIVLKAEKYVEEHK